MMRHWLSLAICGQKPIWPFAADEDIEALLVAANQEGVCALLYEQMGHESEWARQIPAEFCQGIAVLARQKALQSLVYERESRRLLALLEQAGLDVLLLKGSALAYWAYANTTSRERSDIDLLFRNRADADVAIRMFADLKFELVETAMPGNLISFEVTARREMEHGVPLEIDLHWHLSNTPMFAFRFTFDELRQDAIALPMLAPNAYGLAKVPAYLHACMHRVQNMTTGSQDKLKWLYDFQALGQKFADEDWQQLAQLAIERKLAGVCLDGMLAAASCFGPQAPDYVVERLSAAAKTENMDVSKMHGWLYIQRMNFLAYPTIGLRLRWLKQRLLPDSAYMQNYYGQGRGFWQMVVARIRGGLRRLKH